MTRICTDLIRPSLRASRLSLRAKRSNPGRTPLVWIALGYALAMTVAAARLPLRLSCLA
ncbi:MAG: hypothetical protein LBT00_12035 [Spirochaetaceae bacterium]|nr:hypothetical protein [Spirochaetaceae bacterium]